SRARSPDVAGTGACDEDVRVGRVASGAISAGRRARAVVAAQAVVERMDYPRAGTGGAVDEVPRPQSAGSEDLSGTVEGMEIAEFAEFAKFAEVAEVAKMSEARTAILRRLREGQRTGRMPA